MRNDPRIIWPGDRVRVFDSSLFKDDMTTPLAQTMQPATVVRRYGYKALDWSDVVYTDWPPYRIGEPKVWFYPDLLDVIFDHDGRESHGHFTTGVQLLAKIF